MKNIKAKTVKDRQKNISGIGKKKIYQEQEDVQEKRKTRQKEKYEGKNISREAR